MNRTELDAFAARHRLSAEAVDAALALTRNRPDGAAWRAFGARLLTGLGVLGLGAGAIFFVAANWQDFGLAGRFAVVELALVACTGVALWRPPPRREGQAALLLATLLTGALLALFGQSYQTGADVYELFFGWALLALPFVLAAQWGAAWAAWLVVVDVALALYFGVIGRGGWDPWWWDRRGPDEAVAAMATACADFALAALALAVSRSRWRAATPRWLLRFAGTLGFGFGTWGCLLAILGDGPSDAGSRAVVGTFAFIGVATLAAAWRRRSDVFPLALVAASWIAVSTALLARAITDDATRFIALAAWLLALAAATAKLLSHAQRAWRPAAGKEAR